jgi:hypothetical protein
MSNGPSGCRFSARRLISLLVRVGEKVAAFANNEEWTRIEPLVWERRMQDPESVRDFLYAQFSVAPVGSGEVKIDMFLSIHPLVKLSRSDHDLTNRKSTFPRTD